MKARFKTVETIAGQGFHAPDLTGLKPVARNLTQILLDDGDVEPLHLIRALARKRKRDIPVERILLAHGWVTPEAVVRAQARFWKVDVIDPCGVPADPGLIREIGAGYCLDYRILPLHRIDGITLIATSRPEEFAEVVRGISQEPDQIRMAVCTEAQIEHALVSINATDMVRMAEHRVPARESCRSRNHRRIKAMYLVAAAAVTCCTFAYPSVMLTVLTSLLVIGLVLQAALKLTCLAVTLATRRSRSSDQPQDDDYPLPVISVIIPLYKEDAIARDLVQRVLRLHYPRELTDIILVIESTDKVTKSALASLALPFWIRVVEVPDGPVKTKPRALNYALNFCKGQIIGIWDAEDQPEPDQLHHIAAHFHHAPRDLGCVQGVLDFYNPRTNFLARFFTIEYAAWFRVILPAIARLGLVVPLGGTTCFFRREALEHADAWDAWNVTEDADLGVRLARRGWRTEIARTVTNEESNCRMVPWIRQRSRWFKGYALTWGVHMRSPWRLWQDLGTWRFLGFQVQFLFMLSQHILAPVVWTFWLLSIGLHVPYHISMFSAVDPLTLALFLTLLLCTEAIGIVMNMFAVRSPKHRHLIPYVPFTFLYFPLASIAAWKSVLEMVGRPYYWDKTAHGIFSPTIPMAEEPLDHGDTVEVPVKGTIGDDAPVSPPVEAGPVVEVHGEMEHWRKSG